MRVMNEELCFLFVIIFLTIPNQLYMIRLLKKANVFVQSKIRKIYNYKVITELVATVSSAFGKLIGLKLITETTR